MATRKKVPSVVPQPHWRGELTKLRCWITGFYAGRGGNSQIPGEQVLWQIIQAIDDAEEKIEKPSHPA
jgi:hypothetical protein